MTYILSEMLSVAMITHNEEKKLPTTLAALRGFADEIIIVDSYSTDATRRIAEEYGAKVFEEDWKGYGPYKNSAIGHCSGDWILLLDSDEELTEELKAEIREILKNPAHPAYTIPRISYTFGRKTRSRDAVIRLVKKNSGHYDDKEVHETWVFEGSAGRLTHALRHHTYLTYDEYFEKFNRYTGAAAREMLKKGKRGPLAFVLCDCALTFVKGYFLKGGFLDGRQGFVNSVLGIFYIFVKYVRLEDIRRAQRI